MCTDISIFCLIAPLLLASAVYGQATMKCMQEEPEKKKQCYYDRNLQLTLMPGNLEVLMPRYENYETFFTVMDPHTHCSDPEGYSDAVRCSENVSMSCYDPDGSQGIVARSDLTIVGMQRLCEVKDQVDSECFKVFLNAASDCADYNMPLKELSPMTATTQQLACTPQDLLYDCMEIVLKPLCGVNTTNIYLELMDKYMLPPVCINGSRPSRSRQRLFPELMAQAKELGSSHAASISTIIRTATTLSIITTVAATARRLLLC